MEFIFAQRTAGDLPRLRPQNLVLLGRAALARQAEHFRQGSSVEAEGRPKEVRTLFEESHEAVFASQLDWVDTLTEALEEEVE